MLRIQIEIRDEDVEPLRSLAWADRRAVREQASFLLHLKIQELAPRQDTSPVSEVA